MGEKNNAWYFIKNYKTKCKCFCRKCGQLVFKSHRKGYDYFCPHCQKLLFSNEVRVEDKPLDLEDINTLTRVIKNKGY